jgi:hypothetical protein
VALAVTLVVGVRCPTWSSTYDIKLNDMKSVEAFFLMLNDNLRCQRT